MGWDLWLIGCPDFMLCSHSELCRNRQTVKDKAQRKVNQQCIYLTTQGGEFTVVKAGVPKPFTISKSPVFSFPQPATVKEVTAPAQYYSHIHMPRHREQSRTGFEHHQIF